MKILNSVLITTFNAQRSIGLVLQQLIDVLPDRSEIIVVDDGSDDSTVEIVSQFLPSDRLKLVQPGKVGRAKALNVAFHASSGDYIFINDADDVSSKIRFSESQKLLDDGVDMVFGDSQGVDDIAVMSLDEINRHFVKECAKKDHTVISSAVLYKTNPLCHSTMAAKRHVFESVDFYSENLKVCIDLDLYFKVMSAGYKLAKTSQMFLVRTTGNSRKFSKISSNNYFKTLISLRKKYRKSLKPSFYYYLYDIRLMARLHLKIS